MVIVIVKLTLTMTSCVRLGVTIAFNDVLARIQDIRKKKHFGSLWLTLKIEFAGQNNQCS